MSVRTTHTNKEIGRLEHVDKDGTCEASVWMESGPREDLQDEVVSVREGGRAISNSRMPEVMSTGSFLA